MSDKTYQPTGSVQSSTGKNAPTHSAYHVRDVQNGKSFWTRIGSAWAHKDDQGFSVQLDIVPLDGCISIRTVKDKTPQ